MATARDALRIVMVRGLVSVQGAPRTRHLDLGLPMGGPLEPARLRAANRALGNVDDADGVEVCGVLHAVALRDLTVAVDGARVDLAAGQALDLPGDRPVRYLALAGGVVNPFGRFGALPGDTLATGDTLVAGSPAPGPARPAAPLSGKKLWLEPGPDELAPAAWTALLATTWTIAAVSRVGTRLRPAPGDPDQADALRRAARRPAGPARSNPLLAGFVELPPDGAPIVLGPDHPVTGGYPVVALLHGALGARSVGEQLRFEGPTADDARRAQPRRVPLNIDLGELPDEDPALYALADIANVACGGHAGDECSMRRVIEGVSRHGGRIYAHPSYPDRANFGRLAMALTPAEVEATVREQCARLAAVAGELGVPVTGVKPHGALYHAALRDPAIGAAVQAGARAGLWGGGRADRAALIRRWVRGHLLPQAGEGEERRGEPARADRAALIRPRVRGHLLPQPGEGEERRGDPSARPGGTGRPARADLPSDLRSAAQEIAQPRARGVGRPVRPAVGGRREPAPCIHAQPRARGVGRPVRPAVGGRREPAPFKEGFADRGVGPDGRLVPRGQPGDLVTDPRAVAARAAALVDEGVDTVCVHGDTPGAVHLARVARHALAERASWTAQLDAERRVRRLPLPPGVDRGDLARAWLAEPGVVDLGFGEDEAMIVFAGPAHPLALPGPADGVTLPGVAAAFDPGRSPGVVHEIPVRYDGADLEVVARATGLTVDAVIALHLAPTYVVAHLGFLPGFAYLDGLDPRLQLPRRSTPRPEVPAGAVAIAGARTAVYPCGSPGGWHLLGSTELALFNRETGPLLRAGDRVRFQLVD